MQTLADLNIRNLIIKAVSLSNSLRVLTRGLVLPYCLFALLAVGFSSDVIAISDTDSDYVANELLVAFFEKYSLKQAQEFGQIYGMIPVKELRPINAWLFRLNQMLSPVKIREELSQHPKVMACDLNHLRGLQSADPYTKYSWHLNNTGQLVNGIFGPSDIDINWPEAILAMENSYPVKVSVIDSGVAVNHSDLLYSLHLNWREIDGLEGIDDDNNDLVDDYVGWDFVYDSYDMLDRHGHGTHVAGIIGATAYNGEGITGVNPGATIVPVRIFDQWGRGRPNLGIPVSDISLALLYSYSAGARVCNLSLGGEPGGEPNLIEMLVFHFLSEKDMLAVIAAGNDDNNNDIYPTFPASYPNGNILSVAAQERNGGLASFSNYGAISVDIAAPGTQILSTDVTRKPIAYWDFSSFPTGWKVGEIQGNLSVYNWTWSSENQWISDGSGDWNYENDSNYWVRSPFINAGEQIGTRLTFTYWSDLEDWSLFFTTYYPDRLYIEYSLDGSLWHQLGYTGHSTGSNWSRLSFDIPEFDGHGGYVRWRFYSDWLVTAGGVVIADVAFTGTDVDAPSNEPNYSFKSGTSMAAPVVAGVASLLLSERPDLTVEDIVAIIRVTARPLDSLNGVIETGGMVDAHSAIKVAQLFTPRDYEFWRERTMGNGSRTAPHDSYSGDGIQNIWKILAGLDPKKAIDYPLHIFETRNNQMVYIIPRTIEVAGVSLRLEVLPQTGVSWIKVAEKPFGYPWVVSDSSPVPISIYEEYLGTPELLMGYSFVINNDELGEGCLMRVVVEN